MCHHLWSLLAFDRQSYTEAGVSSFVASTKFDIQFCSEADESN